jgi:hypothetical protein
MEVVVVVVEVMVSPLAGCGGNVSSSRHVNCA